MKFELGKYYKHTTDYWLHICGIADTVMWGRTLIAEQAGKDRQEFGETISLELVAVGSDESATVNFTEVTREEFINQNYSK